MHCGSPVLPVNYVLHGLLTGKIFTHYYTYTANKYLHIVFISYLFTLSPTGNPNYRRSHVFITHLSHTHSITHFAVVVSNVICILAYAAFDCKYAGLFCYVTAYGSEVPGAVLNLTSSRNTDCNLCTHCYR